MTDLNVTFECMLNSYGPQGWWPLVNVSTGECEYRGVEPRGESECLEIVLGAILTQGVAWKNVEVAIRGLRCNGLIEPRRLRAMPADLLAQEIRSTGYYNQKALKIGNFLSWFETRGYSFSHLRQLNTPDLRAGLLSVSGIGPETADSILLYALGKRVFVVDAYTRRIFSRLGHLHGSEGYWEVQKMFHDGFAGDVKAYREYHALIVAHAKNSCRKSPACHTCIIRDLCDQGMRYS